MDQLFNLHTHLNPSEPNEIGIRDFPFNQINPKTYYSISIHPWTLSPEILFNTTDCIHAHSSDINFVAIGECGLDKLCSTPFDLQLKSFREMIEISEALNKPLIIHCVKAFNELILLKKEFKPKQTWIIHGFRGNPNQALQLINHGFCLSFGAKHNSETIKVIPLEAFFAETDNSENPIGSVYCLIACELNISANKLAQITLNNARKYLNITI